MKPARPPAATPQINAPRVLTASRFLPATAWPDWKTAARPTAIARNDFCIPSLSSSLVADVACFVPRSIVIEARATDHLRGTSLMQDLGHRVQVPTDGLLVHLPMD